MSFKAVPDFMHYLEFFAQHVPRLQVCRRLPRKPQFWKLSVSAVNESLFAVCLCEALHPCSRCRNAVPHNYYWQCHTVTVVVVLLLAVIVV
jgi:hypothetical protein